MYCVRLNLFTASAKILIMPPTKPVSLAKRYPEWEFGFPLSGNWSHKIEYPTLRDQPHRVTSKDVTIQHLKYAFEASSGRANFAPRQPTTQNFKYNSYLKFCTRIRISQ